MNIALLHYTAPPVIGGVEAILARQARALTRHGHQVHILAGRGQTWDTHIPVEILENVDRRSPRLLKLKASLDAGEIPPDFAALRDQILTDLRKALCGVDILIAHNVASQHKNLALTAALHALSQSPDAPRLLLWHHDLAAATSRYTAQLHPGYPWELLRCAWPGVRQVTVSTQNQQQLAALMKVPGEQIAVIPNGLDVGEFLGLQARTVALAEILNLYSAYPLLLTPVRINRRKNLELAISVLAALRRGLPQAALVITGPFTPSASAERSYLEQLKELRADLEVENAVHLLAEYMPEGLPAACVADFYRLADALLLTSREEGFGIPILEAGLARMPLFCSDLPSLRALAGGRACYFAPGDSPAAIAGLIVEAMATDTAYKLRTRIRQQYTTEGIYQRQLEPLLLSCA